MHPWIYVGIADHQRGPSLQRWIDPDGQEPIVQIVMAITQGFGVSMEEIQSGTRLREVVEARHTLMWFLKKYTRWTHAKIGKMLDRDHSSVTHALGSVINLIEVDREFRKKVDYAEGLFLMISQQKRWELELSRQQRVA